MVLSPHAFLVTLQSTSTGNTKNRQLFCFLHQTKRSAVIAGSSPTLHTAITRNRPVRLKH